MRRLLSLLTTLTLAASPAFAQAPPKIEPNPKMDTQLQAQVDPTLKRFENAWNKHDPAAMAAVFTDDAVLINPFGQQARGRPQIEKLFRDEHSGMLKDSTYSERIVDLRSLNPNLALVDQQITISGAKQPSGEAIPPFEVHGVWLLTRRDGQWQAVDGRAYEFAQQPQLGVGGAGTAGQEQQPSETKQPVNQPEDATDRADQLPPTPMR